MFRKRVVVTWCYNFGMNLYEAQQPLPIVGCDIFMKNEGHVGGAIEPHLKLNWMFPCKAN